MGRIRVFDPACGSGNFLIIAYKELRALEMEVFRRLGAEPLEVVKLEHFFGIEIDRGGSGNLDRGAEWMIRARSA